MNSIFTRSLSPHRGCRRTTFCSVLRTLVESLVSFSSSWIVFRSNDTISPFQVDSLHNAVILLFISFPVCIVNSITIINHWFGIALLLFFFYSNFGLTIDKSCVVYIITNWCQNSHMQMHSIIVVEVSWMKINCGSNTQDDSNLNWFSNKRSKEQKQQSQNRSIPIKCKKVAIDEKKWHILFTTAQKWSSQFISVIYYFCKNEHRKCTQLNGFHFVVLKTDIYHRFGAFCWNVACP